tara:strand:- start:2646 stop:2843 length:198 start_codon:yes stop_codon:yes gene_type:complete
MKKKENNMRVKDLIKRLEKCNPDLPVYVYGTYDYVGDEIAPIEFVDDTISDRVDLNIGKRIEMGQ